MLKSKVEEVYDYRNVKIPEELLKVKVTQSEINGTLMEVAKKNSVVIETNDVVRNGDQVILEMKSNLEKFNKESIIIVVGLGLFNKNLEDKLVGMKKDEINEISIDGSSVKVKVVNIKRKIVPDVTDEMIKKLEIEDVNTVDEFKRYAYNEKGSKMKEEKFEVIYGIILDEVIEKSIYTLENEDLEKLLEAELNKCRALSKLENLVFEEMTKEQLMTRVARESIEEFKEFLKTQNEITLKWMLVAVESARKENVEFNETTYERFIEQQVAMDKLDIQTTKELNSLFQYIPRQYSLYLKEKIKGYFETKFNCSLANQLYEGEIEM